MGIDDTGLVEDGRGWSHYDGDGGCSSHGQHFHESGWLLERDKSGRWMISNTMSDVEHQLDCGKDSPLSVAKEATRVFVCALFSDKEGRP